MARHKTAFSRTNRRKRLKDTVRAVQVAVGFAVVVVMLSARSAQPRPT